MKRSFGANIPATQRTNVRAAHVTHPLFNGLEVETSRNAGIYRHAALPMKNHDQWNNLKKQLDARTDLPSFREGDVWWCSVGLNIGNEIDGKYATCERPVCILKKFDHSHFFGVPLTSSLRQDRYSYPVMLAERKGFVRIDQGRAMSAKRLQRRLGCMKQTDFRYVKTRLRKMYS